jgi:ribosome biogenesis GTPase A
LFKNDILPELWLRHLQQQTQINHREIEYFFHSFVHHIVAIENACSRTQEITTTTTQHTLFLSIHFSILLITITMAKLVPTLVHPLKSKFFSNHHSFLTKHSFQLYGFQSKHSYSSSSSKISMSLKAGIVGLPNVGKSTLFNAVVSILIFLYLFFGFLCITWNEGSLFVCYVIYLSYNFGYLGV